MIFLTFFIKYFFLLLLSSLSWREKKLLFLFVTTLLQIVLLFLIFLTNLFSPALFHMVAIFSALSVFFLWTLSFYVSQPLKGYLISLNSVFIISLILNETSVVGFYLKEILLLKEKPPFYFFVLPLIGLCQTGFVAIADLKKIYGKDRYHAFFYVTGAFSLTFWTTGMSKHFLFQQLVNRIIKTSHDIVHTFIVTLCLPDHPYLKPFFWKLVNFIFKEDTGLFISIIVILLPGIVFLLKEQIPVEWMTEIPTPSLRKKIYDVKREKSIGGIFIVAVILFVLISFIRFQKEEVSIYDPIPYRVTEDENGKIVLKISGGPINISDGFLHKFFFEKDGEFIRFLVIKKPGGNFGIALDACEICEPEGYAQLGADLFCKYCGTPIPILTVGESGGCNPIPLEFDVEGNEIILDVKKIKEEYEKWVKGKGRSFKF